MIEIFNLLLMNYVVYYNNSYSTFFKYIYSSCLEFWIFVSHLFERFRAGIGVGLVLGFIVSLFS